jgi:proteasome lid subunit RPN8/RPN11
LRGLRRPRLRFSPTAWSKLLYLRDSGTTEVGGFGIAPADDLLYLEDLRLVRQDCTAVFVAFDDKAVAEFFDEQVDAGRKPNEFARVWVHTHPGDSAEPSHVDEETFERVFGRCDWAVMFILAQGGQTYCRLRFWNGPGGEFEIHTEVDFRRRFPRTDFDGWAEEYAACVRPVEFGNRHTRSDLSLIDDPSFVDSLELIDQRANARFLEEDILAHERSF